jgi:hypothetical protein
MSEFMRPQWAVVSERGGEAFGLKYVEALELMRRLTEEKVHGLAIVTDEAARRFHPTATSRTTAARREA